MTRFFKTFPKISNEQSINKIKLRVEAKKEYVIAFLFDPQTKYSRLIDEYIAKFVKDDQSSALFYNDSPEQLKIIN